MDSSGNPIGIILIPTDEDSKLSLSIRYDAFYQRKRGCLTAFGYDGEYMIVKDDKLLFTSSGFEFAFIKLNPNVAEAMSQLVVPSGKLGLVIKPEDGWCAFLDSDGSVRIVGPVFMRPFIDSLKVI